MGKVVVRCPKCGKVASQALGVPGEKLTCRGCGRAFRLGGTGDKGESGGNDKVLAKEMREVREGIESLDDELANMAAQVADIRRRQGLRFWDIAGIAVGVFTGGIGVVFICVAVSALGLAAFLVSVFGPDMSGPPARPAQVHDLEVRVLKWYMASKSHAACDIEFRNTSPVPLRAWSVTVMAYNAQGNYLAKGTAMVMSIRSGESRVADATFLNTRTGEVAKWTVENSGIVGESGLRVDDQFRLRPQGDQVEGPMRP